METRAESDLNWNLVVEMEGSALIQKSTRPSDWIDVRELKEKPRVKDKPQVSGLDN